MHARLWLIACFFLAGLGFSQHAHAEGNCPQGYYPIGGKGVAGCAPIPGGGTGGSSSSYFSNVRKVPQWIAYARSPDGRVLGWSVFQHKQRGANKQAMKACNARSGQKCEIVASFTGQCSTALQHSDTGQMEVVVRGFYDSFDPTSEAARQICPHGCRVVTSDCARDFYPVGGPDRGPNWYP